MIKDIAINIESNTMKYLIHFQDTDDSELTEIRIDHPTKAQFVGRNSLEQTLQRLAKGNYFYQSLVALHQTHHIRLEPSSLKLLITKTVDDNFDAVKKMKKMGII